MFNTLERIPKNAVGFALKLRLVDKTKQPINLMEISGLSMSLKLKSPSGIVTTKTPVFLTDGSDGWIKYIIEAGVLSEEKDWKAEVTLIAPGYSIPTFVSSFYVTESL